MRFAGAQQQSANFGLAPLLDVVLLLLIFFVVTTSFTEPRLALELPEAETAAPGEARVLVVSIDADGTLAIGGEPVEQAELDRRLSEAAQADEELELRADAATPHGSVVEVLDRARKAGVTRVGIAATPGSGG